AGPVRVGGEDEAVPAVKVAVSGDEHARLDLAESIEHPLHAEVRRTRGPDGADRRGAERRNDGFRHIRYKSRDTIAGTNAHRAERSGEAGHLRAHRVPCRRAARACFRIVTSLRRQYRWAGR